jgi:hypothetical protein
MSGLREIAARAVGGVATDDPIDGRSEVSGVGIPREGLVGLSLAHSRIDERLDRDDHRASGGILEGVGR